MAEDMMYDEISVTGKIGEWEKGGWKKIAIHDEQNVKGFFGPYRFLSNFYLAPVWYEGIEYPSTENAYQSAKVLPEYRKFLANVTPAESKKVWKEYPRMDKDGAAWDRRKNKVMAELVFQKFFQHDDLKRMLLDTEGKYLEETLWWKDTWWGYDVNLKRGHNHLGLILMATRSYLKDFEQLNNLVDIS